MTRFHHIRPRAVSDRAEPHGRRAPWDKSPSTLHTLAELFPIYMSTIGAMFLLLKAADVLARWCFP